MQHTRVAEADPVAGRFTRATSEERELPDPPPLRRLIGPSVILIGVGIASGEYILYPYIASQAGLVFLWAAVVGVLVQFFINMEIERYTLATGETALGGFMRMWKPWGGILAAGAILATVWPGWATAAATITTFAVGGGNPNTIAILGLIAIGAALTASPVVYQTVEKLQFIKVGAVLLFLVVALFAVISSTAYRDTSEIVTSFGTFPSEIPIAILVGALAASGAGGANNLVQSNWIRDKGFGMGRYVPRIVSPITGQEEAAPDSERLSFPQDEANLSRWRTWWKRANTEQLVSFALIGGLAIILFSLIAYSTVYQHPDLPDSSGFDFIALEGDVIKATVGTWFGTLFLAVGAISLFAAALGIVDYVARLVADVIHVGYTRDRGGSESKLYFGVVWVMVVVGSAILLAGFDQPLVLVTISTVMGGAIMFVYTCLLLVTNRRYLPEAIRLRGYRIGILLFSLAMLGVTTAIVAVDQIGNLF
jgi:hypothetical protein